ncbi:hypothetical protein [Sinorhizobium prairiense]|uniref:hypothetical protein n=1 Tax=unclassified Sinorhizobium TaxID=2613772 RepID=UPI0023D8A2A7|nr:MULTISPECIES: hypothetical protein [unclassified Sinorhizobium]WEJ11583.1 hypothetical protein N0Q90_11185 [Sinorhizobium sp. M103]WEJ16702.1 hypothetical protein N0Q91_09130 [Sinorhizobium sp. K101]WEJ38579.1 hypothetical protein N0R80_11165 [Sinorhizobium sp. C101]
MVMMNDVILAEKARPIKAPSKTGLDAPVPVQPEKKTAKPTGPPDDDFTFWRFSDLKARNIVSNRTDLHRKQERGFPRPVKLGGKAALFPVVAVKKWVVENMQ